MVYRLSSTNARPGVRASTHDFFAWHAFLFLGTMCSDHLNLYFFNDFLYSMEVAGTMSSKGQITIPKAVRDALGIEPGDVLEFEVRDNEFVGRKKVDQVDWSRFVGMLADGRTTEQVMQELRPERAWDE
jgi:antitoxin PrlF